jgi:pilus assembly protein CpaB
MGEMVMAEQLELVLGQKLRVALQAGDPMRYGMLAPMPRFRYPKRARAYSIAISGARGVGDYVLPDDQVDVLVTTAPERVVGEGAVLRTGDAATRTMLQGMVVLATDGPAKTLDRVKRSQARYHDMTLMMLPEEAEQLSLAAEKAVLQLTLRPPEDPSVLDSTLVTRCAADQCTFKDGERISTLRAKRYEAIQVIRGKPAAP